MPKYPKEEQKIDYIREFVYLTWEAVRRNPDYQRDYRRLLENYELSPDDVKPQKIPDGSTLIPFHPAREKTGYFDPQKRRFVWKGEDEAPDPDKCNLSYMLAKWGFACGPDELPYGPSWVKASGFISKDWRKRHKKGVMPDLLTSEDLKKLPGVLEVERFPKVCLNHPDPEKAMDEAVNQCRKEGFVATFARLPWEVENPTNLTITINLQAPSQLIRYALEFLVEVCKSELKIPDKKIEAKHIKKCFQIYDLYQEGYSEEDIADEIDLTHYKKEESMKDGLDDYLKDWGVPQVKRCLKDAEEIIKKGNII
jgi:hypothetical protein